VGEKAEGMLKDSLFVAPEGGYENFSGDFDC